VYCAHISQYPGMSSSGWLHNWTQRLPRRETVLIWTWTVLFGPPKIRHQNTDPFGHRKELRAAAFLSEIIDYCTTCHVFIIYPKYLSNESVYEIRTNPFMKIQSVPALNVIALLLGSLAPPIHNLSSSSSSSSFLFNILWQLSHGIRLSLDISADGLLCKVTITFFVSLL